MQKTPIFEEKFTIKTISVRVLKEFRVPLAFQDATMGPFQHYNIATITLVDEDGQEGEAPFFISGIPDAERLFFPLLANLPNTSYKELFPLLYWNIRNEGFRGRIATTLGQVDMALYDLAAKRHRLPLHRYLGAKRNAVPAYGSGLGTNYTEKELRTEALNFAEQGYEIIKMKVGKGFGRCMEEDVRRVKLVRKTLGDYIPIAVDANQIWTAEEALRFIRQVADQNIAWFEEPVHSADLHQIREICQASPVPVSFGESEKSAKVFPALAEAGVQHLQPVPGYQCNLSEWMEIEQLAREKKLFFSGGGYYQFTSQILACAEQDTYVEQLKGLNGCLDEYLAVKPELRNGMYHLPEEPGLSARVDWNWIKKKDLMAFEKRWDLAEYRSKTLKVN
ncbi:mandelate racemase/muconate lactonizing enzyme family protein [Rapidithrix thailandica]|uniref:Mandelate racemase/muconate lactonizing enzyme family protein n=1 Tax=Rapidithrix thailandica TaxID=413964 RepID=A0AAW9RWE6_9BACT